MDRRQGGLGEPEGGHRLARLGQLRQESGHQLGRRRQGMATATVRRPGLKAPPGLVVGPAGVGRRGAVQRLLDPALVLDRETGGRQGSGVGAKRCYLPHRSHLSPTLSRPWRVQCSSK